MSISVSSFESDPSHQPHITLECTDQQLSARDKFRASLLLPGSAVLGEVDPSQPIEITAAGDVTPQTIAILGIQEAVPSVRLR